MAHGRDMTPKPYGMVAEFASGEDLLAAAKQMKEQGYTHMEGYSPIPVHGLTDVFEYKDNRLFFMVFGAGLTGGLAGLGLQYWTSVIDYPWIVGGKPYFSLPSFIPVTFEALILFAALTATFGMFALNGLPKPHHPVFNAAQMYRASQDRFLLCVEASDPKYNLQHTQEALEDLDPKPLSIEAIETSEGY
jgi:hypothetical protein